MPGIAIYLDPQRSAVVTAAIGFFCLLAAGGCQEQQSASARQRDVAEEYSVLPGLRASQRPSGRRIRAHSKRKWDAGTTGRRAGRKQSVDDGWQAAEDESSWVAAGVRAVAIFAEADVDKLDERAREYTPTGPFHYTSAQLERAAAFGTYYERERLLFADRST
jgi:hypothetical protein